MKLVITGAYGFLGSQIVSNFVKLNKQKIVVIVKKTSVNARLSQNVLNQIEIVFSDDDSLINFFNNNEVEGIIHAATNYGRNSTFSEIIANNVLFPLKLIDYVKKTQIKYFINFDSYFNKGNFGYNYLGSYILSKQQLEQWMIKIPHIKIFNLKLEHLYGPNDSKTKFVQYVIDELSQSKEELYLTEGTQERDFIYVDDVVNLTIELVFHMDKFKVKFYDLEVGTGETATIKDFVKLIKNELQNKVTCLKFGHILMRENEIMSSKADLSKLPDNLNWKPQILLKEGVKKLISNSS